MVKTVTACNWVFSRVTEEDLNEYVQTYVLAKKDVSIGEFLAMKLVLSPRTVK